MIKQLIRHLKWILVDRPLLKASRDAEIRLIYNFQDASKSPMVDAVDEVQQVVTHYNYLLHTLNPNRPDEYPGWIPRLSVERFQTQLIKSGIKLTYKRIPSEELLDAHSDCR
ncbi:hypothetical protein Lepto7375DRAFT_7182 [Leptolyngbya sp. PCC 7375]|nr:hypothetical protein Lepto7375DRAFT_7182 [Leptolyngbya sp. PCC 7375]